MTKSGSITYADVLAGVRRPILAYSRAMDDGDVDDVVALFGADASMSIPDMDTATGTAALRELFPKVVAIEGLRHLVLGTVVTEWDTAHAVAYSDLIVAMKGENGWAIGLIGRYDDVLDFSEERWTFHSRVLSFA